MTPPDADETSGPDGPCDGLIITHPVLISVRGRAITVGPTRLGRWWTEHLPTGQWEPETFLVLERYVTSETCYLDVGAFNGATLLFAAQTARLAIGLEPDPVAYAELQRHVALNPGAGDVRIICAAAAPADGRARFGNKTMWGKSSSSLLQAKGGVNTEVDTLRLDTLCQREGISGPLFLKIDIEGSEYALFASHREFFKRAEIEGVLMALHHGALIQYPPGHPPTIANRLQQRWRHVVRHLRLMATLWNFHRWELPSGARVYAITCLARIARGQSMLPGSMLLCRRGAR